MDPRAAGIATLSTIGYDGQFGAMSPQEQQQQQQMNYVSKQDLFIDLIFIALAKLKFKCCVKKNIITVIINKQ